MKRSSKNTICTMVVKGCIPVVLILGFVFGLSYKPKAQALSDRGKKAVGVLVGAAAMGATAGAAGGAKWVPLGLFGGGLTGGLIARSSVKDNYENLERKKAKIEQKLQSTTNQKRRESLEKQLSRINQKLQTRR